MNTMKKLVVYYGDSPVCVEGFSKDCQRSVEGSIHILPGKPKTVTDDEFKHIEKEYAWMKPKLRVVANLTAEQVAAGEKAKVKAKAAKPEAKAEAKPEAPKEAVSKADSKPLSTDKDKDKEKSSTDGGRFKKRK